MLGSCSRFNWKGRAVIKSSSLWYRNTPIMLLSDPQSSTGGSAMRCSHSRTFCWPWLGHVGRWRRGEAPGLPPARNAVGTWKLLRGVYSENSHGHLERLTWISNSCSYSKCENPASLFTLYGVGQHKLRDWSIWETLGEKKVLSLACHYLSVTSWKPDP